MLCSEPLFNLSAASSSATISVHVTRPSSPNKSSCTVRRLSCRLPMSLSSLQSAFCRRCRVHATNWTEGKAQQMALMSAASSSLPTVMCANEYRYVLSDYRVARCEKKKEKVSVYECPCRRRDPAKTGGSLVRR